LVVVRAVPVDVGFWGLVVVGFPFAPLIVGLLGLMGRLGLVGMAGPVGWMTLGEFGVTPGAVPVLGGAVVAPGADGLVMPAGLPLGAAGAPPAAAAAAWTQSALEVKIKRPIKAGGFFITQSRSQFH
jgi:hypothetical protein